MYKMLTREDCLYYQKQMKCFSSFYMNYIDELINNYNVMKVDAIDILEGKNIDEIVTAYNFTYETLLDDGFSQEQTNQILKAKDEGLNLSFLSPDTSIEEMREIRMKNKHYTLEEIEK